MEERGGFEPPIPFSWNNRFRGGRFRPLSHLSTKHEPLQLIILVYNTQFCFFEKYFYRTKNHKKKNFQINSHTSYITTRETFKKN